MTNIRAYDLQVRLHKSGLFTLTLLSDYSWHDILNNMISEITQTLAGDTAVAGGADKMHKYCTSSHLSSLR